MSPESHPEAVRDLIAFIDASPTPYHAVREVARRLGAAGFDELDPRQNWRIIPGQRGYTVHGGGTIVAFIAGNRAPADAGFVLIGAHTDSPNLRVKPVPDIRNVGHRQIAVEVYGGVLFSTWLDRDLGLAGRLSLSNGQTRLVQVTRPIARIANLAIHLNCEVNLKGLILNAQEHLTPTWSLELDGSRESLLELLVRELNREGITVRASDILAHDLCLYDTQGAAVGGASEEFLYSARLDNLVSCHAAARALLDSGQGGDETRMIALYDHEEVGSQSAAGARSLLLQGLLERLAHGYPESDQQATARALSRSLIVSCDMAHAVHPNYADKHDKQHRPQLGKGPVIKKNVNQSYATDAAGAAVFARACRELGHTHQHFVSRNDMPCGSTIGPISAARTGIRTVDVGNPMLSMHSCREMACTRDIEPMIAVLAYILAHPELPPPSV
jgi:aspartyl aminopeptidase